MGAGTSAEEFFLKSINVESIFEFVERTEMCIRDRMWQVWHTGIRQNHITASRNFLEKKNAGLDRSRT